MVTNCGVAIRTNLKYYLCEIFTGEAIVCNGVINKFGPLTLYLLDYHTNIALVATKNLLVMASNCYQ